MVFVKSAEEIEPGKRTFDLPTAFLRDKPFLTFGFLSDLHLPVIVSGSHLELPLIGLISADERQAFGLFAHLPKQIKAGHPIIEVSCADMDSQRQANAVHRKMPFAPIDVFGAVYTGLLTDQRPFFDALTVN